MALNLVQGKQIATASWAVNALTASYLEGYISPFPFTGSATISGSLVVTGSLNVSEGITGSFSGSGANLFDIPASGIVGLNLSQIISGSVSASISPNDGLQINTNVTATSFTGSLFGTASYAIQAETASFAPNYLPLTGGTINGDVILNGTASIAFLNVTYQSSSIIYSTGSNQFGDATNDTQTLIGTVLVSGSQQITGSLSVSQGISGSFSGSGANLFDIPASGITGLNLSQIATGSVTASVSPGTGSFEIVSGSTSFLFVSSSGNVGIGINAPTFRLDVNGTARVGNLLSINQTSQNSSEGLIINESGGARSIKLYTTTGNQQYLQFSSTGIVTSGPSSALNLNGSGVSINYRGGGTTFSLGDDVATRLFITDRNSGGNVLIGTTTNGGFKLDVNGTTRLNGNTIVTGSLTSTATTLLNTLSGNTAIGLSTDTSTARLQVRGTGATSATNTLLLQNSSLTNLLTVRDDGSSTLIGRLNITPTTSTTSSLVVTGPTVMSGSFNTISGSVLTVVGSGSAQPVFTVQGSQGELFSVTDSLSGSLFSVNDISGLPIMEVFSDGTTLIGNYLDPMLITTTKNTLTNSGSFTIYSLPTASYDTAFFDYSIKSGSNARAGQIMAIQSGSAVNYTETTTMDFGSTSGVSLGVFVSGSNMVLTGSAATTAWVIKTIVRSL